ncbi:MAG: hypothetical protein GC165_01970 [Armatimonadetes bacterium]|nr:hypothetical protein [Armatimonadota bacterium]MBS1726951.1 hypothetical protein [Armatimonadota bacterium]
MAINGVRWIAVSLALFAFAGGVLSDRRADEFALGTPGEVPFPKDNPYSAEKAELGRQLFSEGKLSKTGATPCTWCHDPNRGWGDGRTISIGDTKEALNRHSPSLFNVGYATHLFWDGRATTLEEQCLFPIQQKKEMGMDLKELPGRLTKAGYGPEFEKAFGTPEITVDRIAKALATFERTITENDTPYDRWLKGDKQAMSADAIAGLEIFQTKGHCVTCHGGPNFSNAMTDDGVPYKNTGLYQSPVLDPDAGRGEVDKKDKDMMRAFKIPSLRGIGKSAPYMHNGTLASLQEVVDFYDRGGDDGKLPKLGLTDQEKKQLVEFLRHGITSRNPRR